MTSDEAFQAMFAFLEMQYETTHAPELGALRGSMALLEDGGSVDPAIQADWQAAVEKAKKGIVGSRFEISTKPGANEA